MSTNRVCDDPRDLKQILPTIAFVLSMAGSPAVVLAQAAPPCRVAELQRLNFYPGIWDVRLESRLAALGPWETTTGIAEVTADMSGCVVIERLRTTRQGKTLEAITMLTWDHQTSRWQATWIDSDHGMQLSYEGVAGDDGLDLRSARQLGNRTLTSRRLWRFTGPDEFSTESARLLDSGAWDVTGRARYSRRR